MLLMQLAADRHEMHDRKDLARLVKLAFERAIVGKEPRDRWIATEDLWPARADQRVDLATRQQRRQRQPAGILLDRDRAQERGRVRLAVRAALFDRALHPADGREINAKLMRQMPAQPERRGLRVKGQSNALAFDILGSADAGARVDENVAMAEDARRKYRQRHEPAIALTVEADELGRRQLRNIELAAADHAVEHVAAGFERDAGEVGALGPHDAFADRLHAIVAAAREGQWKTRHCVRSRSQPRRDTGQGALHKARGALARPSPTCAPAGETSS